ncbi:MAG: hypothetical protein FLDDKLPJ_01336 [Phycisphaerae bacterium]|nr:hypothetical protein [Phycisphaerae bacterium]
MPRELTIIYEPAEDGWWVATIPEVPGAFSQGRTKAEARANALDALSELTAAREPTLPAHTHLGGSCLLMLMALSTSITGCFLPMRSYENPQLRAQFEKEFSSRELDPIEGFWRSDNEYAEGVGVIYRTDPSLNDGFPFASRTISVHPKRLLPYSPDYTRVGARFKPSLDAGAYHGQMLMVQGARHFWVDSTGRLLDPTTLEYSVQTDTPVLGGSTQRAYLIGPDRVLKSRLAMTHTSRPEAIEVPKSSHGSGFLVSRSHIVTNQHVVQGATDIKCFVNSLEVGAKCIASDPDTDLAILELAAPCSATIQPFRVGRSAEARQGQRVFAMGFQIAHLLGNRLSVHEGILSGLSGLEDRTSQFQVEMSVHPGGSGGPLLDERGVVIGIVTSKLGFGYLLNTGDIPQSMLFAVKSDWLQPLLTTARVMEGIESPASEATLLSLDELTAQFAPAVVRIETTR